MTEADRRKWDERYRAGSYVGRRHASALLEAWLPRLPRGRALDVACGTGRNALRLAAAGHAVDAVDVSAVGLERARAEARGRGLDVRWIEADLEPDAPERTGAATGGGRHATASGADPLPEALYEVIVWVRYVNASLMPRVKSRLADGGYLLCEQHLRTTRADVAGPSSPTYRLAPNALLEAAAGLRVLFYREDVIEDPDGRPAALAQLVACRGSPAGF